MSSESLDKAYATQIANIEKNTGKKFEVLTENSIVEIQNTLKEKKKVFLFSLRKGLATMTNCRDCSTMVACKNCNAPVVLHNTNDLKKRILICSKCKTHLDADTHCEMRAMSPMQIAR